MHARECSQEPHGFDRTQLDPWLAATIPGIKPPLRYRLIAGGRSNLTYEIRDAQGTRWALRRPPIGGVLQSAHDMAREHRILVALAQTAFPVPAPSAYCEDPGVCDSPFHVMEFVDGVVLRSEHDVERAFSEPLRRSIATALVDKLAELHRLDPATVGLGDLGRPDAYVRRQLDRWNRQFQKVKCREVPALDETRALLDDRVPPQQRTSIVHGDFRLDNCVFDREGEVRAVLDWELCTLGDPLADVGLLMVYWIERGETAEFLRGGTPTAAPGFPAREEIRSRYADRSGLDLTALDFYEALGYWKIACIVEGVYARYAAGAMGDDAAAADGYAGQAEALATKALTIAARLP
jgi:aminoglycoside phosphotransferase (APT) family kinase protein